MANWVAAFLVYETLAAIQAWHLKNVVVAARNSGVAHQTGDVTGGMVSQTYVTTAWLGRFNGIAFLLFIAWKVSVLYALGLWLVALLLGALVNGVLRMTVGYAGIWLVANLAIVGVPMTGALAWWWAWNG